MDAPPKSEIQIQTNGGAIHVNVAGPGSIPGPAHRTMMNYSTFRLAKMLDSAAAGSAEHKAIQKELRQRSENSNRPDKSMLLLFNQSDWRVLARPYEY
jgi:hypothetical protein